MLRIYLKSKEEALHYLTLWARVWVIYSLCLRNLYGNWAVTPLLLCLQWRWISWRDWRQQRHQSRPSLYIGTLPFGLWWTVEKGFNQNEDDSSKSVLVLNKGIYSWELWWVRSEVCFKKIIGGHRSTLRFRPWIISGDVCADSIWQTCVTCWVSQTAVHAEAAPQDTNQQMNLCVLPTLPNT